MISAYVSKHQRDWDENLNLLTAAYRSTVHDTTGLSPNYLMLGREVKTPLEVNLGLRANPMSHSTEEYVINMQNNLTRHISLPGTKLGKQQKDRRGTMMSECRITPFK